MLDYTKYQGTAQYTALEWIKTLRYFNYSKSSTPSEFKVWTCLECLKSGGKRWTWEVLAG